jgi:hypothetical protein
VLALFLGNRGYRCERDLVFDIPGFQRAMKNSKDVLELSQILRSQGFSHLMINHRLFDSWASSNFTKLQLQNLSRFSKEAIRPLLITESGQALYELVSMKEK